MAFVFLSFSSKDLDELHPIIEMLKKNKISYFKAPESIPEGSNYAKEIPSAIRESRIFLLAVSGNSQRSIWVEKEIEYAINNRLVIIPVQISDIPLEDKFKFYLNNIEMIRWYENPAVGLRQLELRIKLISDMETDEKAVIQGEALEESGDVPIFEPDEEKSLTGVDKELLELKRKKEKQGYGIIHADSKRARSDVKNPFLEDKKRKEKKKAAESVVSHRDMARRNNAMSVNRIPEECEFCGGDLKPHAKGAYKCEKCGNINYDTFSKVKNYLDENGPTPVIDISLSTGVATEIVEYLLLEEHLEIPASSEIKLQCQGCGAPIRSGRLCEVCKNKRTLKVSDSGEARYRFNGRNKP